MHRAVLLLCSAALASAAGPRVAAFRAEVTPKLGEPLIWTTPAKTVQDPLWAKGVVIESGRERIVLCAVDWCGIGNRAYAMLRRSVAEAAGTDAAHVALETVHQHTAPYVDASAYDLLRAAGARVRSYSDSSLEDVAGRIANAVRDAVRRLATFDRVGVSSARVERVASARRLHGPDGKIETRYSTSGQSARMAEAPEGDIDPFLRTVSFARGSRVLVRLHYYATHPQTFCCEGTVTSDFAGAAREAMEREEGVPQIYFTGAAGDVTVGKYNDGSEAARNRLTENLLAALRRSAAGTEFQGVGKIGWTVVPLKLAARGAPEIKRSDADDVRYRLAITRAFALRKEPLEVSALRLGGVYILHMPGEPMVEFQRFARSLRNGFVAVAGYGDIAPGYICTDRAFEEGGYEPGASNAAPGGEEIVKSAIRTALTGR